MIVKYIILDRVNEREKVVIGATQAREVIKDLLTFNDITMLLSKKSTEEILKGNPSIVELTKRMAEWIVVNLYKEYKFENGSTIASLPKADFDNFSIEEVITRSEEE